MGRLPEVPETKLRTSVHVAFHEQDSVPTLTSYNMVLAKGEACR